MILQLMMLTVQRDPFKGTFMVPGAMPLALVGAFDPKTYTDCIVASCKAWGAEMGKADVPHETVTLAAMMPLTNNPDQPRNMVEALAEIMRVMLAGAIILAKEELEKDDAVIVDFKTPPNFQNNVTPSSETAPDRSYLLGHFVGDERPRSLKWAIPLVDMFYGPNRIRWLDQRSLGHLLHEHIQAVAA
jgi:hypothetical protein